MRVCPLEVAMETSHSMLSVLAVRSHPDHQMCHCFIPWPCDFVLRGCKMDKYTLVYCPWQPAVPIARFTHQWRAMWSAFTVQSLPYHGLATCGAATASEAGCVKRRCVWLRRTALERALSVGSARRVSMHWEHTGLMLERFCTGSRVQMLCSAMENGIVPFLVVMSLASRGVFHAAMFDCLLQRSH